ncbi:MAG: hypothetical protein IJ039_04850 [Clostridia bacterium]|nr:hypothetical protein [Clostridia bacterium]
MHKAYCVIGKPQNDRLVLRFLYFKNDRLASHHAKINSPSNIFAVNIIAKSLSRIFGSGIHIDDI